VVFHRAGAGQKASWGEDGEVGGTLAVGKVPPRAIVARRGCAPRRASPMSTVALLDAELNEMIRQGKALEAFERFYADDVVMMENDQAFVGKDVNRKREQEFFGRIKEVHAASIGATAVSGNTSFCEQSFDATFVDGSRIHMEEVAVRTWKDGKIVKERFYYKGS
jgi:ketosteroid isomerase-like protein